MPPSLIVVADWEQAECPPVHGARHIVHCCKVGSPLPPWPLSKRFLARGILHATEVDRRARGEYLHPTLTHVCFQSPGHLLGLLGGKVGALDVVGDELDDAPSVLRGNPAQVGERRLDLGGHLAPQEAGDDLLGAPGHEETCAGCEVFACVRVSMVDSVCIWTIS